jgi:hypothetical protein
MAGDNRDRQSYFMEHQYSIQAFNCGICTDMNDVKNQIAFTMRIRQSISDNVRDPAICSETRSSTVHAWYDNMWMMTDAIDDALHDFLIV